ncbi:MAG: cupin domain-containing protein [Candidatus Heimdallarchaeota archaeon]|nr:cupin domain-containing protein [Candidatus Heimdallarchaeota archaeon]
MPIRILKSLNIESMNKIVDSERFIKTENAILEFVTSNSGSISNWHHHGEYDIFNYIISGIKEFLLGSNDEQVITAKPGDLVHIAPNTIHRESNPSDQPTKYLLIRVGTGQSLFLVDDRSIRSTGG